MLRSLATPGTVLVSFSLEMSRLRTTMGSRSSLLQNTLANQLAPDHFETKGAFNSFQILEQWKQHDRKIEQWFTIAISPVKSNRRRKKWIHLCSYLRGVKMNWNGFLEPGQVELEMNFNGTNPGYWHLKLILTVFSTTSSFTL